MYACVDAWGRFYIAHETLSHAFHPRMYHAIRETREANMSPVYFPFSIFHFPFIYPAGDTARYTSVWVAIIEPCRRQDGSVRTIFYVYTYMHARLFFFYIIYSHVHVRCNALRRGTSYDCPCKPTLEMHLSHASSTLVQNFPINFIFLSRNFFELGYFQIHVEVYQFRSSRKKNLQTYVFFLLLIS